MKDRIGRASTLLAVAFVGMLGLLLVLGNGSAPAVTEDEVDSRAAKLPFVTTAAVQSVSPATVSALDNFHGITVEPLAAGAFPTKVTPDAASRIAATQFRFVNDGGRLAELGLARVTTTRMGDGGSSLVGAVRPDLSDRMVWVAVFEGFRMEIGGPHRLDGSTAAPRPANASLAVFLDPASGQVLCAAQW